MVAISRFCEIIVKSHQVERHTGANGEFELKGQDFPLDTVHIHISDIDGPENGAYGKMESVVQLTQTESGDGHWYNGKFVATNIVIRLEEEERSE